MTPATTRSVVDLPAPLRPTSATDAPAGTVRSSPSTATTEPNATRSSRTSTTAATRPTLLLRLGVEGLDVGFVVAHDDVALELQRGRQMTGLDRPVVRHDPERLDGLGVRDRLVGVIDRRLHGGAQVVVVDEVGDARSLWFPVLGLPVRPGLLVDRDQTGDERLLVTDDHALADQRVRTQPVLEHCGCDV